MQAKSSRQNRILAYLLRLQAGLKGDWPLAKKLLLLNVLGIAGTLLLCLALFSVSYSYIATQRLKSEALANGHILASNIAPMLVFNDPGSAKVLVHSFTSMPDLVYLKIVNSSNQSFAEWRAHPQMPSLNLPPVKEPRVDWTFNLLLVTVPVLLDTEHLGEVQLQVGLDAIYRETLQFFLLGLVLTCIAIVIASLILNRFQVRALAPIFELSAIAENIASKRDYSLRASYEGNNELGRLSYHFNKMLSRIEAWENDIQAELIKSRESVHNLDILANNDPLTQLPNRRYFHLALNNMLEQSALSGKASALMFIDLDNFKYVNDQYGHKAGDQVLATIADRLSRVLRSTDIACRLGGDEFAAILPSISNRESVKALAARLVAAISQDILIQGEIMPITASVGISCCPLHSTDEKMLLHYADLAMYQAKKAGKNTFRIYSAEL